MSRRLSRGVAMPLVLGGMAVAILVVALAWSRSWTRRTVSAHQSIQWQARLLAESGTACALQEAMERVDVAAGRSSPDTSRGDTAKVKRASTVVVDSLEEPCAFHLPGQGSMSWDSPIGTQILLVHSRGEMTESGKPVVVSMESTWGGSPPPETFECAIQSWSQLPPEFTGKIEGCVRTRAMPLPPGMEALPGSMGIMSYAPSGLSRDLLVATSRMLAAFRSEEAKLGGDRFSPSGPPPTRDSLVYTLGDVVFDGPWTGDPWIVPGPRDLFVEGRLELRGQLKLTGWRIWASGQVVVQDQAVLEGVQIFSQGGVRIADHASVSGQIMSAGAVIVSGSSRILAPAFVAVWQGRGVDSLPRIYLEDMSRASAYLFAAGGGAEIRIGRHALLEGIAVTGGILRNEGVVHGVVAVAGALDCGQSGRNCSSGAFRRDRLPPDFAFPMGLPGNRGVRLLSWSLDR
ncbi:MAG TPA: hypothetical protein PKY05_04005 [Fibrobacteria bacterium]|nr:hypothetical protein [Fibrobacteria bacterium]